jgi:hypothetical protein
VPVKAHFENLEAGAKVDDFLEWFPGVGREQVIAVLEFFGTESLGDIGQPVPLAHAAGVLAAGAYLALAGCAKAAAPPHRKRLTPARPRTSAPDAHCERACTGNSLVVFPEGEVYRLKALRRHLLEICTDDKADPEAVPQAREALDDVQLVLQLYSYPGDYVTEKPSLERMAETIEKFEDDLSGFARPKGKRQARVLFGEPIDLKEAANAGRPRTVATDVTDRLEIQIKSLTA